MNKKILLFSLIILLVLFSCKKKDNSNNAIVNESIQDKITNLIKENNLVELKKVINDTNINQYNSEGLTPLLAACQSPKYEMISFLIEHNADVNKEGIMQYDSTTPLNFLLMVNDKNEDDLVKIINLLIINKAKINTISNQNTTPLTLAIEYNFNKIILLLIENQADVNMSSGYGTTPLELSLRKSNFQIAKELLIKGANVNYHNELMGDNDSILTLSIYWNKPEVVKFLLENGADRSYKNANGKTALDIAKEKGNKEIIDLLK